VQRRDWSEFDGPGAEYFQREEIDVFDLTDPIEPFNRGSWSFNHGLMVGVVQPLAWVYRTIVPGPARRAVDRAATNLAWPRRLVTNLLQAQWTGAGRETARFAINTTIGLLGLFDPAARWGIRPSIEDFGQTFARWGWHPSNYLVLPVFGPSTFRDATGSLPDALLDPATYFFPLGPTLTFNGLSDSVADYLQLVRTTYDPYWLAHMVKTLSRDRVIHNYEYDPDRGAAVETLQSVFLAVNDPGFPGRGRSHRVEISSTERELPYTVWMQDEPAPILYLVPGLGAHRLGGSALALAEMAWNAGFSAVTLSSAMNWEFMALASSVAVPGNAPADSRDVHVALDAIHRDLQERHPNRTQARVLMGYSLGAFHTFYIVAANQDPEQSLIDFDRYVTLDAPVRLLHGVEELDSFYAAPLDLPEDERARWVSNLLRKVMELSGELEPHEELPLTEREAEFLIGLAFRVTLMSVLSSSQEREDLGVLLTERTRWRRASAYEEILDYSFMEYVYAFVVPWFAAQRGESPEATAEALIAQNDLRFIGDALRASGEIRHFANANDFLLADGDIEWLTEVLGPENVEFFPTGGHLGGLFKPEVQQLVMDAVRDLVEPAGAKAPGEPSASGSTTPVASKVMAARPLELLTQ
jgi:ABC-type transporter lipoprotein component MlaA